MNEETMAMMEEEIQKLHEELRVTPLDEEKRRELIVEEIKILSMQLNDARKTRNEYEDKAERRRIDEERNATQVGLEYEKTRWTWRKLGFELMKAMIPAAISMGFFYIIHSEDLTFEETGRKTSFTAKSLKMPNIFKF